MRTLYQTNLALGSNVELTLVTDQSDEVTNDLFSQLWRRIFEFEKKFSRFLPSSELSIFNRMAGQKVPLTNDFQSLLMEAKRQSKKTAGLYNPFVLPALQRAGYIKSFVDKYSKDIQDDHSKKHVALIDSLEVGDSWARIPHNTALDFGGIGKGYLADQLASMVPDWVKGFWFSLGGDVVGRGTDGLGDPWQIRIQDASNPDSSKWTFTAPTGKFAIATSGTFKRQGISNGIVWHHIIDPNTKKPAITDIISATAVTKRATDADILAKCAVLKGSDIALEFLKKHGVSDGLIQYHSTIGFTVEHFGQSITPNKINKKVFTESYA